MLFKRHSAEHALQSGFLLKLTQKLIAEEADSRPDGKEALRIAAQEELGGGDPDTIGFALLILSAIGEPEDLRPAERFLDDPSEVVRRAARACRYQLRRRKA